MYTKYVGACLMGIALGLKMKSGLEVEEFMPIPPNDLDLSSDINFREPAFFYA